MAVLMTPPYLQFFDSNGVPLAGGKVYTYTATGTFSVPKATYTTEAGTVEHPNPVILDSAGRPTTGNGSIWLSGTYDFKVTDSLDNTIETTLNVTAFTTLPSASNAYFETFSGNGTQTTFTTSEDLGSDEKAIYVWVDSGQQQCVTNGSFASDTGWTKGSGWTIAAGVATASGAISTALSQTAAITLVSSQAYVLTYTVTRSAGGIIPSIGGTNGVERTSSGTYTEVISCGTTQTLAFTGNGFTGTLDNISITVANPKGYQIQNAANYTIDGTTLTFLTAPPTGTGNIYVSAPSLLVGAASSAAADAAASAADAAASAADAAASAVAAAAYAGQLTLTSTSSLAIGTGSKVFTVSSNLSLSAGQFILITSNAAPSTNYMWGQIASYSSTTLTVTVAATGGSGTHADWIMYLTGERGATGATGTIGDLSGVPTATIATADYVIFQDVSDSNLTKRDDVQGILDIVLNAVYPIGSYYINETNSTNPSTLLGFGTWTAVTDRFIMGASGTYPAGTTGGSTTHTLTAAEIPPLNYTLNSTTSGAPPGTSTRPGPIGSTTTASDASSTGCITTNAGGGSHSILNPYIAAYIWKRTA